MKALPDLEQLTDEAKDALIVVLWEELQKLQQGQTKKPKNSSVPPAQGFKPNLKLEQKEEKRTASLGRSGDGGSISQILTLLNSMHQTIAQFLQEIREKIMTGLDNLVTIDRPGL